MTYYRTNVFVARFVLLLSAVILHESYITNCPIVSRYLQIQPILKKYDILFIADEVCGVFSCILVSSEIRKDIFVSILLVRHLFFHSMSMCKVICAFGRLGTMFGCDKYNIKPDLVSIAKVIRNCI